MSKTDHELISPASSREHSAIVSYMRYGLHAEGCLGCPGAWLYIRISEHVCAPSGYCHALSACGNYL